MRMAYSLVFATLWAGCDCSSGGGAAVGEACDADGDCAAGLVCSAGTCRDAGDAGPIEDVGPRGDVPTGCGEFPFTVSAEPPDLILVVDRSLSMRDDIPGGGSKWDALLAAVDSVTHSLEANVHFGLASYPDPDSSGFCGPGSVLIDPAVNNADAIVDRLTADGTGGATPTAPSLQAVGAYLSMPRAGHEDHPPAILLATDGAPNCNDMLDGSSCTCTTSMSGGDCGGGDFCLDDARTYSVIEAIAGGDPRVPVYVIGLPGTEMFADVLSEMARRGGTARAGDPAYYAAADAAALEAALGEIAGGVVSCVFRMDIAPENPRRVRIIVDGMDVPHTDDRSEGWAYTDADNTVIELFGSWCDRLTDGGSHTVTAEYACEDIF